METDLERKLYQMRVQGEQAERDFGLLQSRFEQLKTAIHEQWAQSNIPSEDQELKLVLRAVNMLERLFMKDMEGNTIARDKLKGRTDA